MGLTATITGAFEARWNGEPLQIRSTKQRALLAWLVLRDLPASREQATALLWPDGGRQNLRQALYALRKLPGAAQWLDEANGRLQVHATLLRPAGRFLDDLRADPALPESWQSWADRQAECVLDRREESLLGPLASLLAASRSEPSLSTLATALAVPDALVYRLLTRARATPADADAAAHARLAEALGTSPEAAFHWEAAGQLDRARHCRAESLVEAVLDRDPQAFEALQELGRLDPSPRIAAALDLERAHRALERGEAEVAEDLAMEVVSTARQAALDGIEASGHLLLGSLLLRRGEHAGAAAAFEEAERGPLNVRLRAVAGTGAVAGLQGDVEGALAAHRRGLELARREGSAAQVARALCNVASDQSRLGRHRTALLRYEEAIAAARAIGDPQLEAVAAVNGSIAALWSGELGRCRTLVRTGLELAQAHLHALALVSRAELEAVCGRLDEAAHWAQRAIDAHLVPSDPVRLAAQANLAVYGLEAGTTPFEDVLQALERLEHAGRPQLARRARLDAALWCARRDLPTLLQREDLADDAPLAGHLALAAGRLQPRDTPALRALAEQPGHLQSLAIVARQRWFGTTTPVLGDVLEARATSLLPAQRRGLARRAERFGRWLMEPTAR